QTRKLNYQFRQSQVSSLQSWPSNPRRSPVPTVNLATPQKRGLRSNADLVIHESLISSPLKRKSPRRCVDSSPNTPTNLNKSCMEICKSTITPPVGILEFLNMGVVVADQRIRFFRNCLQ
ncbi:hypothetical protein NC651_021969, partial [Populus alba x Populus x berolinensis]